MNKLIVNERRYYHNLIVNQKLTLKDIAEADNLTIRELEEYIVTLYSYKGWAQKLLDMAHDNLHRASQSAHTKVALVDSSIIVNYPDTLINFDEIRIPQFCLNELKRIAERDYRDKRIIDRTLKLNRMVEIFHSNMPKLLCWVPGAKGRSVMFAKYAIKELEHNPDLHILTCSREVKEILAMNGVRIK